MKPKVYQLFQASDLQQNEGMKTFTYLVLICVLICSGGCMTTKTVEKAKGKPGYYSALPLTVAADVVTSPIQIPVLLYLVYIDQTWDKK